jgi:hypothetical protein
MNKAEFDRLRVAVGFPFDLDHEARYDSRDINGFEWFTAELSKSGYQIMRYGHYFNIIGLNLEHPDPKILIVFEWITDGAPPDSRYDRINLTLSDKMSRVRYCIDLWAGKPQDEWCEPSVAGGHDKGLLGRIRDTDGKFLPSAAFNQAIRSLRHLPPWTESFVECILQLHEGFMNDKIK